MSRQEKGLVNAVFLAGGEGKRISQITSREHVPKQLLKVDGKTSLQEGLTAVKTVFHEITTFIVSSPDWKNCFQESFKDQCALLVQPLPLGNADAFRIVLENIGQNEGDILCLNADNLFRLATEELLALIKAHRESDNLATILIEKCEKSPAKARYFWLYDNIGKLKGRIKKQSVDWEEFVNMGMFCGVFVADLAWANLAVVEECRVAKTEGREAKTTEMILRYLSTGKIGVWPTPIRHYGINTPQDLFYLRTFANKP